MTTRLGRTDPFAIVFVCTGNRARSALAEAIFRREAAGVDIVVASVGTMDVGPLPPFDLALEAGRRLGVDLSNHRATPLREVDLSRADLVLGFEVSHISAAVVEGGAHAERTFLLEELVRLLDVPNGKTSPCGDARRAIATADSRRIRTRPDPALVIDDVIGKPPRAVWETATAIDLAVRRLVALLFDVDGAVSSSTR
jgi:protein-tyrosine-phosphatase